MTVSTHERIQASLLALCNQWAIAMASIGTFEVTNLDGHAEIAALPEDKDLIGIAEMQWDEDPLVMITVRFVIATYNDPAIDRLTRAIGYIKDKLRSGAQFNLITSDLSATRFGTLSIARGVAVMPVRRNGNHRAIQDVAVTFAEASP